MRKGQKVLIMTGEFRGRIGYVKTQSKDSGDIVVKVRTGEKLLLHKDDVKGV